jgi:hypothetical protein
MPRQRFKSRLRPHHVGEIAQAYAALGLALSELGEHHRAAAAFERGLDAINEITDSGRDQLACGLADSLLHTGDSTNALKVLGATVMRLNAIQPTVSTQPPSVARWPRQRTRRPASG